ncbi:uncharacterized protein LOC114520492 [Dendronephthya gigantea]|uniref:uncharacterized protein LOC114520492 n=1 Tax=Dendronephthya gigantea TaxID=151771 RepID=UPI00106B5686|nr:uncharacterized protein LOC114520492 [Dendronephthya gigantea]
MANSNTTNTTNIDSNTGVVIVGTAHLVMSPPGPGGRRPPSPPETSQPDGPTENPGTSELEVVNKVSEFLRNDYLSKYEKVNRNPLNPAQTQIQKVFVKPELRSVDDSCHCVEGGGRDLMYRIFESNNVGRPPRRVLICGHCFIGKTMLCQKYVYDWADVNCKTPEPFANFKIVILLKICEVQGEKTLKEILEQEIFCNRLEEDEKEKFISYMKQHPSEFLFLLDGVNEGDLEHMTVVNNILMGKDLKDVYLIATTRPEQRKGFLEFCKTFNARYCISSYNENAVKEFVSNFFVDETKCKRLLEQLENNKDLMEVAKTPLVRLVMCELMKKDAQDMSLTLTKVLDSYTDVVIRLYDLKMGEENEEIVNILNRYESFALSEVMKTGEESTSLAKDKTRDKLADFQMDSEVGLICTEMDQMTCKFAHEKIRDYFAARWIVENWSSKKTQDSLDTMMNDSENSVYSSVLVFVAGLLSNMKDLLHTFLDNFLKTVREYLEQSFYCNKMDLFLSIVAEIWKEENSEKILKLFQGFEPFRKAKGPTVFPLDMSHGAAQGLSLIVRGIQATRLNLSGIKISNEVASIIAAKCLKKNCKVKSVKFSNSYLYPEAIKVVCNEFKSMLSLKEVDLTCGHFATNDGLHAIADLLNDLPGITSLHLENNPDQSIEKEQIESQRGISRQESLIKYTHLSKFQEERQKSSPGEAAITALINAIVNEECELEDISLPSFCVGDLIYKWLEAFVENQQLKRIKLHLKKLDKRLWYELVKFANNMQELEIMSVVLEDEESNRSEYETYSSLSDKTKGKIKVTIKDHTQSTKILSAS